MNTDDWMRYTYGVKHPDAQTLFRALLDIQDLVGVDRENNRLARVIFDVFVKCLIARDGSPFRELADYVERPDATKPDATDRVRFILWFLMFFEEGSCSSPFRQLREFTTPELLGRIRAHTGQEIHPRRLRHLAKEMGFKIKPVSKGGRPKTRKPRTKRVAQRP